MTTRWREADLRQSGRGGTAAWANATRAKLATVDWSQAQMVLQHGHWAIYIDESLLHMTAYVEVLDQFSGRIVVSDDTWETLSYDGEAVDHFLEDMKAGGGGMKYIVVDAGSPYQRAVRNEAAATGSDTTGTKDRITQLNELLNGLVSQAVSLNRNPTAVQRQAFAVRYGRASQMLNDLRDELDRSADLLSLAAAALSEL